MLVAERKNKNVKYTGSVRNGMIEKNVRFQALVLAPNAE